MSKNCISNIETLQSGSGYEYELHFQTQKLCIGEVVMSKNCISNIEILQRGSGYGYGLHFQTHTLCKEVVIMSMNCIFKHRNSTKRKW